MSVHCRYFLWDMTWSWGGGPAYYQKHVTISFTRVINIQNTVCSFEAHKKHHLPKKFKLHSVAEQKRNMKERHIITLTPRPASKLKIKRMSRRWRSQMTIFIYKYFLLTASTMTTTIVDDNSWLCTMAVFLVQCVNTEGCQQESIETEEFTQTCCHCVTFHFNPSLSPFEWWKLKLCWSRSSFPLFMFYPLSLSPALPCLCQHNAQEQFLLHGTVKPPDCGDIRQPVINVPPRWNLSRACRVNPNPFFLSVCIFGFKRQIFWLIQTLLVEDRLKKL